MAIAITLENYLQEMGATFDVVNHPYSLSSLMTAQSAHISSDTLAKTVVLEDSGGYLVAVLPASNRLEIDRVDQVMNRNLEMASEEELSMIFKDCEIGAIPPTGVAYGLDTILDASLCQLEDVYFEAGDHTDLIHMSGEEFRGLMADCQQANISHHR